MFTVDVCFNDGKVGKKTAVDDVLKHAIPLLNSGGGIIELRQTKKGKKSATSRDCDEWLQIMERRLGEILLKDQFSECFHYDINVENELNYIFVRSASCLYTEDYAMKIPKHRSVEDAKHHEVIGVLTRKHYGGSKTPSSSLETELSSSEDEELDSGCTEEINDENGVADVPPYFTYGIKIPLQESSTVQFKKIKAEDTKSLVNGIDNYLPKYVSAFANHSGGKVFFGIEDDSVVTGQSVENEQVKHQIEEAVGKVMDRKVNGVRIRIWGTPDFTPEYNREWSLRFIEVQSPKNDSRFVIEVQIFPFIGGMFLKCPRCLKVDEATGEIVQMDFNEWKDKILRHEIGKVGMSHLLLFRYCYTSDLKQARMTTAINKQLRF